MLVPIAAGVTCVLATASPGAAITGLWRSTQDIDVGATNAARSDAAAVLLQPPGCGNKCGKVLMTGGSDLGGQDLATARLYDPGARGGAGGWSSTTAMHHARHGHTMTRLPSGKVLVAQGSESPTSEVYDPLTELWSTPVPVGGSVEQAVLLNNGTVLGIGGLSATLYDPDKDQWVTDASLNIPRGGFTATVLDSGKVLVAGGLKIFPPPCSGVAQCSSTAYALNAELYDPVDHTFHVDWAHTLHGPHTFAAAALLPNRRVLLAGSYAVNPTLVELYDPDTGEWTLSAPMSAPRAIFPLVPTTCGVLAVGGHAGKFGTTALSEIYNPAAGAWAPTGPLAASRERHVGVAIGGRRALVAGGQTIVGSDQISGGVPLDSAEVLDGVGPCLGIAPVVTGLDPSHGPTAGMTRTLVSGLGFAQVVKVSFGNSDISAGCAPPPTVPTGSCFRVVSPNLIEAYDPPGSGTVDVTVSTSEGTSPRVRPADAFTYDPGDCQHGCSICSNPCLIPPVVTAMSPTCGVPAGGDLVYIDGSGFAPGAVARFGNRAARTIVKARGTRLTALTPAHAPDPAVSVVVVNPDGGTTMAPSSFAYEDTCLASMNGHAPTTRPAGGAIRAGPGPDGNTSGITAAPPGGSGGGALPAPVPISATAPGSGVMAPLPGGVPNLTVAGVPQSRRVAESATQESYSMTRPPEPGSQYPQAAAPVVVATGCLILVSGRRARPRPRAAPRRAC